jgi:hypothetical protein
MTRVPVSPELVTWALECACQSGRQEGQGARAQRFDMHLGAPLPV